MTRARRHSLLLVAAAGLVALGITVPLTAVGAVPQWDNLVLAAVAGWSAWRCGVLTRAMGRRDRLPW